MDLNLVTIQLELSPESYSRLLLLGTAARFEAALRTVACKHHGDTCKDCRIVSVCPFPLLCARQLSSDPELVKLYQRPGVPFVVNTPQLSEDNLVLVRLVLLGPAIHHISLFIQVFKQCAGVDGLQGSIVSDYQKNVSRLIDLSSFNLGNIPILSAATLIDLATPQYSCCRRLQIEITSPLRIIHQGRELRRFEPERFIKAVLRRISSLLAYYGVAADPDQFRRYSQIAEQFKVVSMSISHQDHRGVSGRFMLDGPCDELGPLLSLGSMLHVGKGASFGMGDFGVIPCN